MTLRIGISARLLHKPPPGMGLPQKRLQYLENSMAHWIMNHGVVALMVPFVDGTLPTLRRRPPLHDLVRHLDGLVLQGGVDVDPASYGAPPWCGEGAETDPIRDAYELELLAGDIAAGKPVLGICRGIQFLNVHLGGTLYQDLPTEHPSGVNHHQQHPYDAPVHAVTLTPGSPLQQLLGQQTLAVNSLHHQAIRALAPGLAAMAVSEDGLVEAVCLPEKKFVWAVQWHPEF